MAGALEEATEEARQVEQTARTGISGQEAANEPSPSDAAHVDVRPVHHERGEATHWLSIKAAGAARFNAISGPGSGSRKARTRLFSRRPHCSSSRLAY